MTEKKEGRTQLVGYASEHGIAKQGDARKMDLETLRHQVEEHRRASALRYQARLRYENCGAVYDALLDKEIAWCGSTSYDPSGFVTGYDFAQIIVKALNAENDKGAR